MQSSYSNKLCSCNWFVFVSRSTQSIGGLNIPAFERWLRTLQSVAVRHNCKVHLTAPVARQNMYSVTTV